jgi:hypothetical protein
MDKRKRPGTLDESRKGRAKGNTAGDTESKSTRPKQDHKGMGAKGTKTPRARGD